jgi:murein DD-endopeptidase MepM/ murein hydrolase activator NlpD
MRSHEAYKRLQSTLVRVFPEHEFTWHRAEGARVIKLGTRHQVMGVVTGALVAGWLGLATSQMVTGNSVADAALAAKQAELAKMQAQLAAAKQDVAVLQGSVAEETRRLEARQQFLASLIGGKKDLKTLAAMLPRDAGANNVGEARDLLTPSAQRSMEPLKKLANQQREFAGKAAATAEARLRDTQAVIRRLGLDPQRFLASSSIGEGGVGGPYVPVSAKTLAQAEPEFGNLYTTWKKLAEMQAALAAIPSYVPVKNYSFTSSYGVRYDPFNGGAAMHMGLDMAGSMGEPIYAAANGVVETAGRANGYGNLIELEHGKGLSTRYGHLSQILVHDGETVKQGQLIGRMGSTGRSTGTHLHFEVRVDGRAVNPRPFLEASAFVLAAQAGAPSLEPAAQVGPQLATSQDEVTIIRGGMTPIPGWQ